MSKHLEPICPTRSATLGESLFVIAIIAVGVLILGVVLFVFARVFTLVIIIIIAGLVGKVLGGLRL